MSKVFIVGASVICTSSASCGYTKGKSYEVFIDDETQSKAIKADDGFTDLCVMLVSTFKADEVKHE